MEIILLIIYSIIVWFIFFKKKWLPWNITSQVIVVTIPIFALTVIILFMNIVAPSSRDVRAMNYVIPIVPRVTGQVTEVPIEPNRPIKKGDVLFKIDPDAVPARGEGRGSDARAEQGEARDRRGDQRGLEDQLKNAAAKKAALDAADRPGEEARRAIHRARRHRCRKARRPRAGAVRSRQSRKRIPRRRRHGIAGETEARRAHRDGRDRRSRAAKAQIAKAEADLVNAKYDLEGTTHLAPANGRVANLALRPGVRATQFADHAGDELHRGGRAVGDRLLPPERTALRGAGQRGGNLRGDVSGPHHQVQGGLHPVGHGARPDADQRQPAEHPADRRAGSSASPCGCSSTPKDKELFLAAGARGDGAIYTEKGKLLHIIRKVFVRVSTKIDWFVFKLH